MARVLGRNLKVFAGARHISGRLNSVTSGLTGEPPEVTTFGEDNRTRLSDGLTDSEFSYAGFFDASASQIDETFNNILSSSVYYAFFTTGLSPDRGREFGGVLTEYTIDGSVEGAAAVNGTVSGSSPVYFANSLGFIEISSASSGSFIGSEFNMAASAPSIYGAFRVYGLDRSNGDEEISACIQHSDDGNTWATVYAFTGASTGSYMSYQTGTSASNYRRLKYELSGTSPFSACIMASTGSIPY